MRRAGDDGNWTVLLNVTLVNLVAGGIAWIYLVMVTGDLLADFGLGIVDWGKLWAGIAFGVLALSIPSGALADRFGVRRVIGAGLLLNAAALLLRANAQSFSVLLVSMVLFGMSLGVLGTNLPKTLGLWFPPERLGFVNGIA